MFAHSYSSRQSRVCWWNIVYALRNSTVFRWWRKDTTESCWFRCPTDRVFQVDGPAASKLRGPKRTDLVAGTTRSRRTAERR